MYRQNRSQDMTDVTPERDQEPNPETSNPLPDAGRTNAPQPGKTETGPATGGEGAAGAGGSDGFGTGS
jgi:hypothetical protein